MIWIFLSFRLKSLTKCDGLALKANIVKVDRTLFDIELGQKTQWHKIQWQKIQWQKTQQTKDPMGQKTQWDKRPNGTKDPMRQKTQWDKISNRTKALIDYKKRVKLKQISFYLEKWEKH